MNGVFRRVECVGCTIFHAFVLIVFVLRIIGILHTFIFLLLFFVVVDFVVRGINDTLLTCFTAGDGFFGECSSFRADTTGGMGTG